MKAFEEYSKNLSGGRDQILRRSAWRACCLFWLTQNTKGIEEDGSISQCNFVSLDRVREELGDE